MNKKIEISDDRILDLYIGEGIINISEGFIVDGNLKKYYDLTRTMDYSFNASSYDDEYELNEIQFEFNIKHPLYSPLNNLLNNKNTLIIDDDDTVELNKKYIKISKNEDKIILSFINELSDNLELEKFSVFIKNIMFDLRSKIDDQQLDTQDRLHTFFSESIKTIKEEYQQNTIEKSIVKRKK